MVANLATGIPECSDLNQSLAFLNEFQQLTVTLKSSPETCGCPFDCNHLSYKLTASYYHQTAVDHIVSFIINKATWFSDAL